MLRARGLILAGETYRPLLYNVQTALGPKQPNIQLASKARLPEVKGI
jgi:hypothetical protein